LDRRQGLNIHATWGWSGWDKAVEMTRCTWCGADAATVVDMRARNYRRVCAEMSWEWLVWA
jgi:hypothetical protein